MRHFEQAQTNSHCPCRKRDSSVPTLAQCALSPTMSALEPVEWESNGDWTMTQNAGNLFSITGDYLRELAEKPNIGPTWSDDFIEAMFLLKSEADAAPAGLCHAPRRIPELVAEGIDLVTTLRIACDLVFSYIKENPTASYGFGPSHLRPTLRMLAEALEDVAHTQVVHQRTLDSRRASSLKFVMKRAQGILRHICWRYRAARRCI